LLQYYLSFIVRLISNTIFKCAQIASCYTGFMCRTSQNAAIND